MARLTVPSGDAYLRRLAKLGTAADGVIKKAIFEGAKVVAEAIKGNIQTIPNDTLRHLKPGEQFTGLPQEQKEDLAAGFGIASMEKDGTGWNAKLGFSGYGRVQTKRYPNGWPNVMLARGVESGSSVRVKFPFVRRAVNASKSNAIKAVKESVDKSTQEIMKK